MDEFDQSVMIALLPLTSEWCKIELPHVTLVYAGEIPDLSEATYNEMAKEVLSIATAFPPLVVDVLAVDTFGDEDLVDVLLLRPTEDLIAMRNRVKHWNASEHTTFKPHATIGPSGTANDLVPNFITLDSIGVFWGKEKLIYPLTLGMGLA